MPSTKSTKNLPSIELEQNQTSYQPIIESTEEPTVEAAEENVSAANENPAKVVSPWNGKRQSLLIASPWKSGSSLLSEMFNRNPNFFFYSEPLDAVSQETDSQKLKMLKDIFQCKIPFAENYVRTAKNKDSTTCLGKTLRNPKLGSGRSVRN